MTFSEFKESIENWARQEFGPMRASVVVSSGRPGQAVIDVTITGKVIASLEPFSIALDKPDAIESAKDRVRKKIDAV